MSTEYKEKGDIYFKVTSEGRTFVPKHSPAGAQLRDDPNVSIVPWVELPSVTEAKEQKAVDAEALSRIQVEMPEVTSLGEVAILEELSQSAMSPKLTKIKDIAAAGKQGKKDKKNKDTIDWPA